jgi:hypothetical protein
VRKQKPKTHEEFQPLTDDSMYEHIEHTGETVTMELRGLSKGISPLNKKIKII